MTAPDGAAAGQGIAPPPAARRDPTQIRRFRYRPIPLHIRHESMSRPRGRHILMSAKRKFAMSVRMKILAVAITAVVACGGILTADVIVAPKSASAATLSTANNNGGIFGNLLGGIFGGSGGGLLGNMVVGGGNLLVTGLNLFSGLFGIPAIPAIPNIPAIPAIPAIPQIPAIPAIPSIPPIPAIPAIPSIPPIPAIPPIATIPPIPAIPQITAIPAIPQIPAIPAIPPIPAIPAIPTPYAG
ncbi:MAG: hypothetical protein LBQ06_06060 [Frankiaceae bacterium]|nr:hypothetical protein [Frankiaceae bacterium]